MQITSQAYYPLAAARETSCEFRFKRCPDPGIGSPGETGALVRASNISSKAP